MVCKSVMAYYSGHGWCVVCLSYRDHVSVTPRSGRDVMRAWGCIGICGGLPLSPDRLPSLTNKSHLHVNRAVTLFRAPGALW